MVRGIFSPCVVQMPKTPQVTQRKLLKQFYRQFYRQNSFIGRRIKLARLEKGEFPARIF